MAANTTKPKQASRWGSLLSGAVAGLESRLDNILAEEGSVAAQNAAKASGVRVPSPAPASSNSELIAELKPHDLLAKDSQM